MNHRTLFNAAALFNLAAGIPLLVAPGFMAGLFSLEITPAGTLFMQLTALAIAGFGIIYGLIARDPLRHRPYILLGVGLKIAFVGFVYAYWLRGHIGGLLPLLAAGDVIFSILFVRAYRALHA
tara:strand:+ start:215 stop:583 length:369 start_codon:yes stop_codon:yes gene_type:complete